MSPKLTLCKFPKGKVRYAGIPEGWTVKEQGELCPGDKALDLVTNTFLDISPTHCAVGEPVTEFACVLQPKGAE